MRVFSRSILTVVYILLSLVSCIGGYFGLTARHPWSLNELLPLYDRVSYGVDDLSNTKLCGSFKLHRQQRRMCRRGDGVAVTLVEALRLASMECAYQFNMERWNCTLAQYRQKILQKGFKETSYLYAISAAAMVHAISNACSKGIIDRCTCDESKHIENAKTWMWGGCGHNIKFGLKFTRKFLRRGRRSGKDIRAKLDAHNTHVGIKAVKDNVNVTCKCHGVSGSCTMQSCWRQLSTFHKVGTILKLKYEHAVKISSVNNHANKVTTSVGRRTRVSRDLFTAKRGSLVYIDKSPSFCHKEKYSPGTTGRVCNKGRDCNVICCGRGYNTKYTVTQRSCQCQVIWCCQVNCKKCEYEEKIYMCK